VQIERVISGATPTKSRRLKGSNTGGDIAGGPDADGFARLLDGSAAEEAGAGGAASAVAASGGAAPAARLDGLMTYESAFERVAADRKARRHGRAMLRALGALQVSLLDGAGTEAQALAQLAACLPEADDPILRLILREIGVRAAVELARRGAAANISIG
jgi:hypothetical protein